MKNLTKNEIKQVLPLLEELEHLNHEENHGAISDLDNYDETYIYLKVSLYTQDSKRTCTKRFRVPRNDICMNKVLSIIKKERN